MDAVQFSIRFARCFDARVHVVHFRSEDSETGRKIIAMARELFDEEDLQADFRIEVDPDLQFRPGNRVGRQILRLVDERGYDHVIMGHHGTGAVDSAILGSATRQVSKTGRVPVTIVP
jgi:nucleotide-binding universal stress UspA family protein